MAVFGPSGGLRSGVLKHRGGPHPGPDAHGDDAVRPAVINGGELS